MKRSFGFENLIVTILIFFILWLFSIIPYKLIFLDPLAKAAGDFELTDIVFSKLYPERSVDTNIVLVNIAQLNRAQIAHQINTINLFEPKVIGIDAIFSTESNHHDDTALAEALKKTENLVLVGILDKYNLAENYYESYIRPYELFSENAIFGYANLPTKYGIYSKTIRSFRPYSLVENTIEPAFAVRVAEAYNMEHYNHLVSRANDLEVIKYRGNINKFITLDAEIFSKGIPNLKFLKGKIVLLGFIGNTLTQRTLEDIYFTPLNEVFAGRSYPDMYGVTIHANIVSMILSGDYINTIPSYISAILAFIVCFINVHYIRKVKQKLVDYYGGITKLLIFIQTVLILIIHVNLFLMFNYKMSFTLMLVGLIFIPSTIILYDNLLKHLSISFYQRFIRRKTK